MKKYSIGKVQKMSSGPNALLLIPLSIITVFCFGLILLQPQTEQQLSNKNNELTSKQTKPSATPNIHIQTEIPIINPLSSNSTNPTMPVNVSGTDAVQSLQNAAQNNGNNSDKRNNTSNQRLPVIYDLNDKTKNLGL